MIDKEFISAHGLNRARDSLPMFLAEQQSPQYQQVQRSLQQSNPVSSGFRVGILPESNRSWVECQQKGWHIPHKFQSRVRAIGLQGASGLLRGGS